MLRLAELQSLFARGLLDDPDGLPGALFDEGPIPVAAALRVHRNTVLGALAHALALTYPTVAALIGEACFDQVAAACALEHPPAEARLAAWGGAFPEILAASPQTAGLAWLPDVARFDLAIHRAASAPLGTQTVEIEPGIGLAAPASLRILELHYRADQIRDAVETGDEAALAAVDLSASLLWIAVWRAEAGATARALSRPAGLFLAALLAGRPSQAALDAAIAAAGEPQALSAIQSEVFAAPFAAVIPLQPPEPQP